MATQPTPHDALFKAVFSRLEHAAAALAALLPPAIVARLDLSTLALRPGSFIDEALTGRHSDLLFSAQLSGRPVLIYVLSEHQSTVEPLMAFRLLRYMVRIWEAHLADHPRTDLLPAILPLVVHHSEQGWQAAVSFEALLDLDPETLAVVRNYVPMFQFVLEDISHAGRGCGAGADLAVYFRGERAATGGAGSSARRGGGKGS